MGTENEAYLDAASDEDEEAVREEVRNREDEYGKELSKPADEGEMKANRSRMNDNGDKTAKYAVLWHGRDANGRIFHHISHTYAMFADAREHAMRDYALAKHGIALDDDESWQTFKQEHALELNLLDLDLCRDMKANYEEGGEVGEIVILEIGD